MEKIKIDNLNDSNKNFDLKYKNKIKIIQIYKDTNNYINKSLILCGWIRSMRVHSKKELVFIDLSDGSTVKTIQVVIDYKIEGFEELFSEPIGTGIYLEGILVESKGDKQKVSI